MERVWASRLRWRVRGAWLAPVLAVLTLADAAVLRALPLAGEGGPGLVAALLLASFLNLVAIAALAPFAAMALRRLRPDLPRVVARDRAGSALVALVSVALLAAGLVHRPALAHDRAALADAHARGMAWIGTHAPAEFRRHTALADTIAIVAGRVFRTCVPGGRQNRAWCVVVRREGHAIRFAGGEPNALFQAGRQ